MKRWLGLAASLPISGLTWGLATSALATEPPRTVPAGQGSWLLSMLGLSSLSEPAAVVILAMATIVLSLTVSLMLAFRARHKLAIYVDVFGAVPHPRQVVDAKGRTVNANPPFYQFFPGADRPAPDLLLEIADDEEAREQLGRLVHNAAIGLSGYAEVRVRRRRHPSGEGRDGVNGSEPPGSEEAVDWLHVAAQPVRGRSGLVLWMIDDITIRRQMEQVIQEEQESFVDLLEHAPIGFYSVDGEGRFLFVNETLAQWLAIRRAEMTGNNLRLHDVVVGALPEGAAPYDPFGDGGSGSYEVTLCAGAGEAFQAYVAQDVVREESGAVLRTRSVVRNLTHERAIAEALAQSEHRFERFFKEAPVGIALLDGDGRIREYNDAVVALIGTGGAVSTGASLLDMVAEVDRAAVQVELEMTGRSNGSAAAGAPIEVRLSGRSDTVCALFINRLETGGDAAAGYIAHFLDITEQKSLEAQFSQSQKMQAVGQLAGGMAHDFNNLLTAMIGFSDLLLLRHRPGDQSFADVMQIKQNANRAANLVRQLLAFSRQQTLQPRILDITDILAELTHLLRRLIGESIELKMIHGRDLGSVKADQGQLEQVIINLAVNARDAMAGGGQLTITTENVMIDHEVKHKGEDMPPGAYTKVEVSDTGCGISQDIIDRIFEPFFSTKEVGAGTGLGLSTVYGIVKQTGGFIFVRSKEGTGTKFSIYLPHHVRSETEVAAAELAAEVSQDLTGIGTVLLVEDEDGVRAFSARALRNKGYDVLEARSGDAAIELLNGSENPIDLLITDVVMPRIDGPSLVREVRESRPDLKVIFISGYTEDTFRKRLDQESGIHFLAKPFSLKQLAGKVKEVMSA